VNDMQKLTNREEEVMQVLWKLERAFVKEIMTQFPKGQFHYNTLSTMVRNLEEKGYVAHEAFGKTHRYYPVIAKETYRQRFVGTAVADYFNNSYKNLVSFFAQEEKISVAELKEIIKRIENKS